MSCISDIIQSMKQYTGVLFDWDGTIAKTLDIWCDALVKILKIHGYNFSKSAVGADYQLFRARFSYLGEGALDEIIEEALVLSEQEVPNVALYAGAVELLDLFHKKDKQLGIVTTSEHATIDPLLKKRGLDMLFTAVVCGDDVKLQKPSPDAIYAALKLITAEKSEVILVGDSEKDIVAAKNAGIDSVLFSPPDHKYFHDIKYLQSLTPTYTIKALRELASIVL